ncbi:MAG: GerMN domain-containing protein [Spirochaetes bacterium]|uniref:GerMN domain-containing protein n=1 Tax=Candidatus Ornithospirochaeta stercoripullorum TaxID=2840899 RepID=A0A9D9E2L8_9SPIO|nr:GerMN domain-containing protein [Candidatus Ornithospirochaeta stercoripullorum]
MGDRNKRIWPFLLLLAFTAALSAAVLFIRFPYIISLVAEYKSNEADTNATLEIERALFKDGEEVFSPYALKEWGRDTLHLAAEAAIAPVTSKEKAEGLVSYVPKKTRLIGISERDGYIFINLSDEMEKASEEAFKAIEDTIMRAVPSKALRFLIEGEEIELPVNSLN